MKKFKITYVDDCDPGCPTFTTTVKANDKQQAEERFYERDNDGTWENGGWKILSCTEIKPEVRS